jgi:L-iditol 2-dehydrogenase
MMRAAVMTGVSKIQVHEEPEPRLAGPRDVLVRIDAVGICGSDLHYFRQGRIGSQVVSYPFRAGHECAGTVLKIGAEVRRLRVGQRVAIDPLVACGACDQCRAGRPHTCRNQKFLGSAEQLPGALAEYLVMPAECCYPIPDSMTAAQAALVEPFSVGLYAARLAALEAGAKVGILGSGPIGLSVLLAARALAECRTYVTDLVEERLAMARRCGADWVGNAARQNIVAEIRELAPEGLDVVLECAGEQETLDQAAELLKPGGRALVVGIPDTDRISFDINLLRRNELTVQNVRRQNHCVGPALEMLSSGRVQADPLITHHFTLDEVQAAFDLVATRRDGVIKAIIHPNSAA